MKFRDVAYRRLRGGSDLSLGWIHNGAESSGPSVDGDAFCCCERVLESPPSTGADCLRYPVSPQAPMDRLGPDPTTVEDLFAGPPSFRLAAFGDQSLETGPVSFGGTEALSSVSDKRGAQRVVV